MLVVALALALAWDKASARRVTAAVVVVTAALCGLRLGLAPARANEDGGLPRVSLITLSGASAEHFWDGPGLGRVAREG